MKEDDFNSQAPNTFYDFISKPRPLHHKSFKVANSVFDYYTTVPNPEQDQLMQYEASDEPLHSYKPNNLSGQIDKQIHQIGQKFLDLFKNPIYEMHNFLKLTSNNQSFGQCQINASYMNKIKISMSPKSPRKSQIFQFDSRFQSGNLALACLSQTEPKTYNLFIHKDLNSAQSSTTQWFYFSIKNKSNIGSFTFNIVNYMKPYSAFATGMKPCTHSKKGKNCWIRAGQNIRYRRNTIVRQQDKYFYTLSFTYEFKFKQDEVLFAYSYPYTYTKLLYTLSSFQSNYPNLIHRRALTRTIGGNQVDLITITNPEGNKNKKVLLISARVHPGQTVSSFCCQGFIQFLLGKSQSAQMIRSQFIVKIIPMLNPDGVVNGNYRASLSGEDLNRKWKNPDKNKHSEIFYTKRSMLQIPSEKCLYVDFHGHSKKKSSFMYGCRDPLRPNLSRQFPYLLSKKGYNFNYYACNFHTSPHKQGTSRVTLSKEMKIAHCYTMEVSFCGAMRSQNHFKMKDYMEMGKGLGQTIALYFCQKKFTTGEVQQIISNLYKSKDLLKVGEEESDGSASESSLEDQLQQPLISTQIRENQKSPELKRTNMSKASKKWVYLKKHSMIKTYRDKNQQFSFKPRGQNNQYKIAIQDLQFQLSGHSLKGSKSLALRNKETRYQGFNDHLESFNTTLLNNINSINDGLNFNSTQVLMPLVLRSEYKKYERFRKQQINLNICQSYQEKEKQKKNCSFYPHKNKLVSHMRNASLLESIKNKKEITSIYKRGKPNYTNFSKNVFA